MGLGRGVGAGGHVNWRCRGEYTCRCERRREEWRKLACHSLYSSEFSVSSCAQDNYEHKLPLTS